MPYPGVEMTILDIYRNLGGSVLDRPSVLIEIVGDCIAVLLTFPRSINHEHDKFYLVEWKKGAVYEVVILLNPS
jgi:hypothetical protein